MLALAALALLLAAPSPALPNDDEVTAQAILAIVTTSDLAGTRIAVSGTEGALVLTGQVGSAEQKARAEAIARAVPGVRSLKSTLVTAGMTKTQVPDSVLRQRAQAQLTQEAGRTLTVGAVARGRVTVRGDAPLPVLARGLRAVHALPGVTGVRYEHAPPSSAPPPTTMAVQAGGGPDFWVTFKTKVALMATPGVPMFGISIETTRGHVELEGKVKSAEARDRVEQVVRAVRGVRSVASRIQVAPDPVVILTGRERDDDIRRQIRKKLSADGSMSGIAVGPVRDGTVTLRGEAGLAETLRAIAIARSVSGVERVNSQIKAPASDYSRESRRREPAIGGWV